MTMLSSASTRSGKNGAGCEHADDRDRLAVEPSAACRRCSESPPKRFIQYSCVSTITGGTPGPSSLGVGEPAEDRREAHDLEVVAGDEADVDADGVVRRPAA